MMPQLILSIASVSWNVFFNFGLVRGCCFLPIYYFSYITVNSTLRRFRFTFPTKLVVRTIRFFRSYKYRNYKILILDDVLEELIIKKTGNGKTTVASVNLYRRVFKIITSKLISIIFKFVHLLILNKNTYFYDFPLLTMLIY